MKKHYFNLVEIALATAILAVGMSSILVLFPVGINASKSAIAHNNLADISDYMISFFHARLYRQWNQSSNNSIKYLTTELSYRAVTGALSGVSDTYASNHKNYYEKALDESKLVNFSSNANYFPNLKKYQVSGNDVPGFYVFQQKTGDAVDFSAAIFVWWEEIVDLQDYWSTSENKYAVPVQGAKIGSWTASADIAVRLCMEISWPAEVPYENREKFTYVEEIFNPMYQTN